MRRILVPTVVVVVLAAMLGTGMAEGHVPEHPHLLVQRPVVELDGGTPTLVDFRKCVDLAGNKALPLNSHHEHLHVGPAGVQLFEHAGQVVIPAAPFPGVPWTDCAHFETFLPLPVQ